MRICKAIEKTSLNNFQKSELKNFIIDKRIKVKSDKWNIPTTHDL